MSISKRVFKITEFVYVKVKTAASKEGQEDRNEDDGRGNMDIII